MLPKEMFSLFDNVKLPVPALTDTSPTIALLALPKVTAPLSVVAVRLLVVNAPLA